MKKLYKLSIKTFLGPFVATFFIVLFLILMQFLWKYVDDLVGKGLEWYVILELLFYASASFVPLALPLAVLLSSIMTFGEMAENYELLAFKSAGVSLLRIMTPLIIMVTGISLAAFFFSNQIIPKANLKFSALLWDVKQKRPALNIREGVFYNGLDGYSIRVDQKREQGQVKDILIYDHSQKRGNTKVIRAEEGQMLTTADERWMILRLYDGVSYEEMPHKPRRGGDYMPHNQVSFDSYEMSFDLSAFKLSRTREELFRHHAQMANVHQLQHQQDSLNHRMDKLREDLYTKLTNFIPVLEDSFRASYAAPDSLVPDSLWQGVETEQKLLALGRGLSTARTANSILKQHVDDYHNLYKKRNRVLLEWHRKYTLSVACLVLFFIGAPMGAIIRKGGLGMPTVVSVFFFIIFHVLSITAEKTAKEFVISAFTGMWFPFFILTPIGIFLAYKANRDSSIFSKSWYGVWIKHLTRLLRPKSRHPA